MLTADYLNYARDWAVPQHWMFLLACGAVVNNGDALDDLQSTLYKWKVPYTFGFTAPTFNAHLASEFFAIFGTRVIIEEAPLKEKTICSMLDLCWSLRRHGSLLLFRYPEHESQQWMLREEYMWFHIKLQPAGKPVGMQCPLCKCIGCLDTFHYKLGTHKNAGIKCLNQNCRYRKQWTVTYERNEINKEQGNWRKV